jgi:uncharacterized cupin superfamily protein
MYTMEPGGAYHCEGEKLVNVIRGEVEFWLNEVERHLVRSGDCLTFPNMLKHHWRNVGSGAA